MISLQNILGRLMSITRADTGAETEETATASQLLRLPPEIILMIANMLPTPAAACFALCNRRLSYILGPGFWRSLRRSNNKAPPDDILLAFLSCLAKDLPQHFVCQVCARLHRISSIRWPRIITRNLSLRPRCTWWDIGYRPIFWSGYRIYFPHVQLAMKQHYCGTDIGFPLEAFQHLEIEYDQAKQKTTLLYVDAQVISNELLMRSQTWILLPWNRRDEFIDELVKDSLTNDLCVHTQHGKFRKTLMPHLVKLRLDQLEARGEYRSQTLKCPYCWMDYVLDVIDFKERGFAILLTRWVNLGAGLSPEDAKWECHITTGKPRNGHHSHHPGDIRTSFEDQAELSVKELTVDNELKLFSRRRNRLIYRGSDGLVWKWDQRKRWYLAPSGPPEMSFWEFLMSSQG